MEETQDILCPYCGELQTIFIDVSVRRQKYIEDCQVCCQPMGLDVFVDPDRGVQVSVEQTDA